jgi:glycosyltransferase involved in cell wall biosynthesis
VLTLDPYFPEYAAQSYRFGNKVQAVPDPAFPPHSSAASADDTPARRILGTEPPKGRMVFLLFGALTARKGILQLMEALRLLPEEIAAGIAVVIAGQVAPGLAHPVAFARAQLEREQPNLWLHIEDRWLRSEELDSLVQGADVILAPYQRFVGSSGVLLWAARAGKPLLTQDYGLLGRLVRDHRLGVVADVTSGFELAAAIIRMAESEPARHIDPDSVSAFIAGRTPAAFAHQVLNALR